jgi:D-alanine-D-alanine ligase
MQPKLTIAILYGGNSAERQISLQSGTEIAKTIQKLGHHVLKFDPKNELNKFIRTAKKIDLAWPALHGRDGEDGSMQGLLKLLKIPFVGSDIIGSANAFDKTQAKKIYRANKIPVAPDFIVTKNSKIPIKEITQKIGFPCFVKPTADGSSFGATKVTKKSELTKAIKKAWQFDHALVEKFLDGTEISIGIVQMKKELKALPVIEIQPKKEFFDLTAKYDPQFCEEICPARIPSAIAKRAQDLAKRAHLSLDLRHLSRTDFIISHNRIYTLETNTMPGFTKNSLLLKAAQATGISFEELVENLIDVALN